MPKASTKAARATRGSPRKLVAELRCRQCPDLPLRTQCPHSAEGRQYLQRQSDKPERAPQRCTKCPDRPLRLQCVHTNAGREFLRQRDIEQTLTTALNGNVSLIGTTKTLASSVNPIPALTTSLCATILPSQSVHQDSTPIGGGPLPPPPPHLLSTPRALFPAWNRPAETGIIPINPFLSTPRGNTPSPNMGSSQIASYTPRSEVSLGSSSTFSSDVFGSTSAESSNAITQSPSLPMTSTRKKYERPTKTNPKFGYVKGAMRGSDELAVLRKRSQPNPSKDSSSASKDFLEGVHRVLERAEDVAVRTGCWIFVGAQHPGAVSGTIHYSSPRLRRDAADDTERIVNEFNLLMTSLLRARRTDALEASKKLEEACQKNAALQMEVLALKNVIEQYSTQGGEPVEPVD